MNKLKRDFALGYVVGFNSAPVATSESGYKPDADWLPLPPALDGQITLLANDISPIQFYLSSSDINPSSVTVSWGDGAVETYTSATNIVQHTYAVDSGHVVANGTSQFIIKVYSISSNACVERIHNNSNSGVLLASVNVGANMANMSRLFHANYELCQVDILSGTIIPIDFCGYCHSLKAVNVCDGIVEIQAYAFEDCYSLNKININMPSLITIGDSIFDHCYSLRELDLSNTQLTSITGSMCSFCPSLTKVKLPNTITSIGNQAFWSNYALSYINIPTGCIKGANAFQYCYSLHPTPV